MKNMKKIYSLLLAMVMIFSMTLTAYAEGETGSITIKDAVVGQTYTIYQILDLESYSTETDEEGKVTPTGAYSYKATKDWSDFINQEDDKATAEVNEGIKGVYVNVDDQGYVTWVDGADAAAFAKLAQAYAKEKGIADQGTQTASAENAGDKYATVSFTGLDLGYYLVDTTLGTLCSLDTTNPSVVMEEKNEEPTIEKEVQEDSEVNEEDGGWGESNTAEIGDIVNFKTIVYAKPGAQNYVVHDKMSEGLTLNQNSIVVTVGSTTLTKGTDYTVAFNVSHGTDTVEDTADDYTCDFEITFAQTYLDTIKADTELVITYSAILNDDAVISTDANTNDTKLDYGDDSETEWDQTTTFTFKFDLVKIDSEKNLLEGARFELYEDETGENKIALVKENDGVYRIATDAESVADNFTPAVIEGSQAVVKGLDADTTYWLEEIVAPVGYNKLASRVKVEMKDSNLNANILDGKYQDGGVYVENKAGTELPSTGGIGTTIFYIVGGVLVFGAVVLLVTKRRMNK